MISKKNCRVPVTLDRGVYAAGKLVAKMKGYTFSGWAGVAIREAVVVALGVTRADELGLLRADREALGGERVSYKLRGPRG